MKLYLRRIEMIRKTSLPLLLILMTCTAAAQKSGSAVLVPAPYDSVSVIVSPETGKKIVCNQLQVIFRDGVRGDQRRSAVNTINGTIAGYLDDLDIYQIMVPNRKCEFTALKQLLEKLSKHKSVSQVSYRVVEERSFEKIDVGKLKPQRHGQLDMQPAERKKKEQPSEMDLILDNNKKTLYTCIEQFPGSHGESEFRIIISPEGGIKQVTLLKTNVKNKKITDCMKFRIGKWNDFPPEAKGFDRNLEFSFKF